MKFLFSLSIIVTAILNVCSVHALNKLPYAKLDSKAVGVKEGVLFLTYSSLIASSDKGRSRLQQLVQWCGPGFDGLLVFDEVFPSPLLCFLARSCVFKRLADQVSSGI